MLTATGCSSIWGASSPSTPYCKNAEGKGPAWANSLFEDNAEYGFGMMLATEKMADTIENYLKEIIAGDAPEAVKTAGQAWIDSRKDAEASKIASAKLVEALTAYTPGEALATYAKFILDNQAYLIKKSHGFWWRRLGLRYRLRRTGSCFSFTQKHQRVRTGYRNLL